MTNSTSFQNNLPAPEPRPWPGAPIGVEPLRVAVLDPEQLEREAQQWRLWANVFDAQADALQSLAKIARLQVGE
jgi:hypothetical protein